MPFKDPEKGKAYRREYLKSYRKRPEVKAKKKAYMANYFRRPEVKKKKVVYDKFYHAQLKLEVLSHYSDTNPPQCANPFGEHEKSYTDIRALSLDFIKGGHRKSGLPLGDTLYNKLKREGYPKNWMVLCMNCQWIKRDENGELSRKSHC